LPGAAVAASGIEWLNHATEAAKDNWQARESLIRVLSFVIAISTYTRQRFAFRRELEAFKRAVEIGTATATKEMALEKMALQSADSEFDLHNELTAMLARYHFVLTVDAPDALRFRGPFEADSFAYYGSDFMYPNGFREADAVLCFFQLAQQNYISNVLPCRQCHRFFYLSRRNHKFCSKTCRSDFWNASDQAKEARRKASRERRARERNEENDYWRTQGRLKPKGRSQR
jgi:hypothetical protein